jgi:hypothetical protein
MAARQSAIINRILTACGDDSRLFKINAGVGWVGRVISKTADRITIKNPRPLHAAPKGWPDLAGWRSITITPDMVGKRVAVFTGIEVKATGSLTAEQHRFGEVIAEAGGVFEVVRD